MSNDCFGHAFLVTVKITGIPPRCRHCLREVLERILFPWSLFLRSRTPRAGVTDPESGMGLDRLLVRPQFNYEPFNSNSINICSWSWNYRGCWHQTCPPIVTRCSMGLNIPHCKLPNTQWVFGRPISFRCLTISWHWAICAPAALRRSGSHFSGSLSGIEP